MAATESGNARPDGVSASYGPIGGAYYWNPGSPSAPHVTITRRYGVAGTASGRSF